MECLITKLKAEVDNPNLPILETIQQITLDAIAASGNTSMTDAQKYALNHFFYQLGAVDNSALWSKIDGIILPFLANDAAHSIVDYKTISVHNPTLEATFKFEPSTKDIYVLTSGGVAYYHDLFEYSFDATNFSFVNLTSLTATSSDFMYSTIEGGSIPLGKRQHSTANQAGVLKDTIGNFWYRWYTPNYSGNSKHYALSFGSDSSLINGYYCNESGTVLPYAMAPTYNPQVSYPSYSNSLFRIGSNATYGCIVGKAMTADELMKVFSNLIELRAAFVS